MTFKPSAPYQSTTWRDRRSSLGERTLAAEVPIAFVFDGGTEAVMMATPTDLEDFAVGFALNDGIVSSAGDIREIGIVEVDGGIELRMALNTSNREALVTRRRHRAGPVGCGLCGVESIEAALPILPTIKKSISIAAPELRDAMASLAATQTLNRETHAVHAAALFVKGEGIVATREDVGRHNALDKLAGALARTKRDPSSGVILMTSRVSVELIQKAARMGASILAAISAPTTLAVREAAKAGLTVAGIVRADGLEVFTHPERIADAR